MCVTLACMGFIANRNVDVLADEARKAAEREDPVFVTVLHSAAFGATDGELQVRLEWAKRIAGVESEGYRLEQFSVMGDGKGRPTAYVVFRRLL